MYEIISKFLLFSVNFMLNMHLKRTRFTASTYKRFAKNQ